MHVILSYFLDTVTISLKQKLKINNIMRLKKRYIIKTI